MSAENQFSSIRHRRLFLRGALAGAAGAVLDGPLGLLSSPIQAAPSPRKAKACILLWMGGGPSQLDMLDLKPEAPAEIRGEFKPIATNVKGIQICEHLPLLAKQADKLAIVRSMNTTEGDHGRGTYHMLTGYPRRPDLTHPEVGAVVAKYRGNPKSELPGWVTFNAGGMMPGEGFLGPAQQPLRLPSPQDAPEGKLKTLCDISGEWNKLSTLYGDSDLGKNFLAARRLVEAGVPFVLVAQGGYDVHGNAFQVLKDRMDVLDPAWSGLLRDLSDRGLLQQTLVVWVGEFGRTPRINVNNGRDHWVRGWSAVLAGGGVKGGVVYGATDKTGESIQDNPVSEGDWLATIYNALGIDPQAKHPAGQKMVPLTPENAKPIMDVLR